MLGHTGRIVSLVFSDDSILLASGSADSTTIVWDVETGSLLHKLGPHHSCNCVLAFSGDNAQLTTTTESECFVWVLKSGELLERRDRDMSVDEAQQLTPYYLSSDDYGWQIVMERPSNNKKKCLLFRPPAEYGSFRFHLNPSGDRAALLCDDGRVVILDISRVANQWFLPWNILSPLSLIL